MMLPAALLARMSVQPSEGGPNCAVTASPRAALASSLLIKGHLLLRLNVWVGSVVVSGSGCSVSGPRHANTRTAKRTARFPKFKRRDYRRRPHACRVAQMLSTAGAGPSPRFGERG